jgi:streptogramin lyase
LLSAPAAQAVTITEFVVPAAGAQPFDIVTGPDGRLWFTDTGTNAIGRIDTGGTSIEEFPLPSPTAAPRGIALGPDGNLWVSENGADRIARITPAGTGTDFSSGSAADPWGITGGPDGRIWYTSRLNNFVGRIETSGTNQVTFTGFGTLATTLREITSGPRRRPVVDRRRSGAHYPLRHNRRPK